MFGSESGKARPHENDRAFRHGVFGTLGVGVVFAEAVAISREANPDVVVVLPARASPARLFAIPENR